MAPAPKDVRSVSLRSSVNTGGPADGLGRDLPYISRKDVEKHNSAESCWLVIDNYVYDVTSWLYKHPGGEHLILFRAGSDASDSFLAFHAKHVRDLYLHKYRIGFTDKLQLTPIQETYRKMDQLFEKRGWYNWSPSFYVQALTVCFGFLAASLLCVLYGGSFVSRAVVGGALLGLYFQQLAFVGHDLGHNVCFPKKLRPWMNWFMTSILGISVSWWKYNHNCHHSHTNSVHHDPDVQLLPALATSKTFFLSPYSMYHKAVHTFDRAAQLVASVQHHVFFPLMAVARFNLYVQSLIHLWRQRNILPFTALAWDAAALGAFQYLFWGQIVTLLPSTAEKIVFVLLSHAVSGLLHIQITLSHFALPHFAGVQARPDSEDWVTRQTETTQDITCGTALEHWFHGGLECQLEHHLFPRLTRNRLRESIPIIENDLLRKHKVQSIRKGWIAAISHLVSHLRVVGEYGLTRPAGQKSNLSCEELWDAVCARG